MMISSSAVRPPSPLSYTRTNPMTKQAHRIVERNEILSRI